LEGYWSVVSAPWYSWNAVVFVSQVTVATSGGMHSGDGGGAWRRRAVAGSSEKDAVEARRREATGLGDLPVMIVANKMDLVKGYPSGIGVGRPMLSVPPLPHVSTSLPAAVVSCVDALPDFRDVFAFFEDVFEDKRRKGKGQ
jgi:hypothetical protein